jgi:hypothetical protein
VKRERATQLVEQLLQRLDAERHAWPANLITEVYLFGSFARGAVEPHDIDVAIEMDRDDRWIAHAVQSLSSGRNPQSLMRRALVGNSRSFGFFFDGAAHADFPLTLLWRRGEAISIAAQRLHALAPDPTASRAPRDAMLPQFEGLDRWIDRPAREHLTSAVAANAISIERLDLPDATVADSAAAEYLLDRWNPSSPLYRAGHAVLAHVEQQGHDPRAVHLHGNDVHHRRTPHFAGFSLRYFKAIPGCLTEHEGIEWIEIPHLTRTGALAALRIVPLNTGLLDRADWS